MQPSTLRCKCFCSQRTTRCEADSKWPHAPVYVVAHPQPYIKRDTKLQLPGKVLHANRHLPAHIALPDDLLCLQATNLCHDGILMINLDDLGIQHPVCILLLHLLCNCRTSPMALRHLISSFPSALVGSLGREAAVPLGRRRWNRNCKMPPLGCNMHTLVMYALHVFVCCVLVAPGHEKAKT